VPVVFVSGYASDVEQQVGPPEASPIERGSDDGPADGPAHGTFRGAPGGPGDPSARFVIDPRRHESFIAKPFSSRALRDAVGAALAERQMAGSPRQP
jgi:hypothetical protein